MNKNSNKQFLEREELIAKAKQMQSSGLSIKEIGNRLGLRDSQIRATK
ncbi:MAG: hypothetical protein LUF91_07770 [Oscillospiraceae bacterium]|nr:hypothetical protein [Oscillospiraceae bacterium]